ncbi:tRNA isopentenyltransferase [Ramaria rubella]|nr:tRNA isopentenyltransferase [Ramaria rubella]
MVLKPLISIIGTTGVGKSRLAIDLALAISSHAREHGWHAAKVINSDSMQVYAGADVITNKVSESERRGVAHLLMSFKEPGEQYVVGQWVNDAVKEIDDLHHQKTIPIVVGGTAYWMQHLLFPNRLTSFEDPDYPEFQSTRRNTPPSNSPALEKGIASLPEPLLELFVNLPKKPNPEQGFTLYSLLSVLDPTMASRWHWKDTRKVLRNLEIIKEKGLLASEVMAQQARCAEGPRYSTLVFWLFSEPDLLHTRLNDRVDEMIQQGLLDDVRMLQRVALSDSSTTGEIDTTSGVFQAIGFKEFSNYLSSPTLCQKQYADSIERTKISTRQYAKRQIQWIRNKFLPAVNAADKSGIKTPVFLLNVADLDEWNVDIRDMAIRITQDFLDEKELPDPRSLSQVANCMLDVQVELKDPTATLAVRHKVVCDVCTADPKQPFMVEEGQEWRDHVQSRKHRRLRRQHDHPEVHPRKKHKTTSTDNLDLNNALYLLDLTSRIDET